MSRMYAHARAFDVACPACRTMHVVTGAGRPGFVVRNKRDRDQRVTRAGYDQLTGVLTCRGCKRPWYVGLVLWRVKANRNARPEDHIPTPSEAAELRGFGKGLEEAKRKREPVNLVCWCGAECPVHGREDESNG